MGKVIERIELPGQLSVWDIEITQPVKKATEKVKKVTQIKENNTQSGLEITVDQQRIIGKYKADLKLNRIIQYCGGSIGIELKENEVFKTIYVNKGGKEEFTFNKKSPVMPWDKVLYYREDLKPNELQEEKLKVLKIKYKGIKEIRRKGDENILVEYEDKVISIIPKGWVLEFNNVQALYDEEDIESEGLPEDLEAMQKRVKVGDIVVASIGKEKLLVQGEITRIYGIGDYILNIVYEDKHTAIGRYAVRKIIKCA
ncbi:hypothetical protein [Clostridium ganghwense]|uniref:Uncharacterized protein n=1 Tax=Clostridium ganghwense TaxID=312089 RepID=A0ABT4CTN2_9CLOT|nr:hypothetical protein [Clostridium ganghwense]MCY6372435.1 hypothetical protein [Clostridium ganghwense]